MQPCEVTLLRSAAHRAELVLFLNAELFWFRGHFPQQAILPGVAQIDWVMRYTGQLLVADYHLHSIHQLKFQSPMLPNQQVLLSLEWQPLREWLVFSYQRYQPPASNQPSQSASYYQVYSSGKLRLCR